MLENCELNKSIGKDEYKKLSEEYELKLGDLQRKLKDLQIPTVIVFEGWDAAGKGTLINNIIMALDPRGFKVFTITVPNEEERFRPYLWKFWQKLPAKGRISFFDKSWYDKIIENKVEGKLKDKEVTNYFNDINNFEKQLTDYGYLIIKFFLHIDKKEQKDRFEKLGKNKSTNWRVTKEDWEHNKIYDKFVDAYEDMFVKTNNQDSPWIVIESTDEKYASIKAMKNLIDIFEKKITEKDKKQEIKIIKLEEFKDSVIDKIDITKNLSKEDYSKELGKYQKRIRELEYEIYKKRIPVMIMYEGWDASGKGGNIKRLTENMDPRGYEVVPIAAPNDV
ncbi:MAG TPA: phosphate--AMP phosphotransferase, partial [Spirochaetota bacterium]|nr:phosphate--AMP phosphotransferase [Spirochaetota bacterium]